MDGIKKVLSHNAVRVRQYAFSFVKWILFAALTGALGGGIGTAFRYSINYVTNLRLDTPWLCYLLPLGGLVIAFLYRVTKLSGHADTNLIINSVRTDGKLPILLAPVIFVSTIITHLFGGSAGREGAALQLGGSIANQLGRWFKLDDADKRVVVLCGMSAAFSAVFGTPMAAALFSLEVVSIGIMYYAALVPCVFSSLIAVNFAVSFGISESDFKPLDFPEISILNSVETVALSFLCALLSIIFIIIMHQTGDIFRKYLKNPYIRIFTAGCAIVLLTFITSTRDYNGTGMSVIFRALDGESVWYAFILKIIFTAITIEAGFRGGEIVPSFFIGATFGCCFGQLIGFSPSACAAIGLIAMFCGVTNCPITSMLLSFELFGAGGIPYFMICVAVSYFMSGYYGLYKEQTIVYSKYRTKFLNRKTRQ